MPEQKHSLYAKEALKNILPPLSQAGITIVSGGAYGIDTLAHTITLESKGCTVAVVGTGINISYPASNKKLYTDIVKQGGAVVSCFPLGTK